MSSNNELQIEIEASETNTQFELEIAAKESFDLSISKQIKFTLQIQGGD